MTRQLALEIPDTLYEAMNREAVKAGESLEEWAVRQLRSHVLTRDEIRAALDRLLERTAAPQPTAENGATDPAPAGGATRAD